MKAVVIIVIVAVLAVGGYAAFHNSGDKKTSSDQTQSQTTTKQKGAEATQKNDTAGEMVSYTDNGFAVASTTVKSGGAVTFKNNSSSAAQIDSDPHPEHTDNPELNVGTLSPGESKTVTLTKKR